jgi:hypothetical protein
MYIYRYLVSSQHWAPTHMSRKTIWCSPIAVYIHVMSPTYTWCHLHTRDVTYIHVSHLHTRDVTYIHVMSPTYTWCHLHTLDVMGMAHLWLIVQYTDCACHAYLYNIFSCTCAHIELHAYVLMYMRTYQATCSVMQNCTNLWKPSWCALHMHVQSVSMCIYLYTHSLLDGLSHKSE